MSTKIVQPNSKKGPFSSLLGFHTIINDNNKVITELEIADYHLNARDIVHGGVIATMLDNIIGDTIAATVKSPGITINLSINYLSASKIGKKLIARGEVIQEGYRFATGEGIITDEEGNLVAKGTATFKILRPKSEQ